MGKLSKVADALKRGAQNGGRKTYGGGDMAEIDPYPGGDRRKDALKQASQQRDKNGKLIE